MADVGSGTPPGAPGSSSPAPDAGHGSEAGHGIHMPPPSFWPIVLALGIAMALIGVITKYVVLAIGLLVTIVSVVGWIRDARREYRSLG